MYLNIGNQISVRKSAIVGIFDLDNATWSRWTRDLLSRAERAGQVVNGAEEDIPNAFVLCEENGKQTVYLSALTAPTLQRRAEESGGGEK